MIISNTTNMFYVVFLPKFYTSMSFWKFLVPKCILINLSDYSATIFFEFKLPECVAIISIFAILNNYKYFFVQNTYASILKFKSRNNKIFITGVFLIISSVFSSNFTPFLCVINSLKFTLLY